MSEPRPRGPRRETVIKRLADLPTSERWKAEKAAAKQRSREAHGRAKAKGPRREMKPGKLAEQATITWLPEARLLLPGSNIRVVGIASDASDECKRTYGVRL